MSWIRRPWVKNTAAILVGMAVALVSGEALVRVFRPVNYTSDPVLGMIGAGSEHDAKGFRNEIAPQHAEIVALGDSQTYGNNAEMTEAWPQVLGLLASTSVYQMAFGGFSSLQYRTLATSALELSPKIGIIAFYSGNDLLETYTGVYDNNGEWNYLRDPNFSRPATTSDPLTYRQELQTGLSRNSLEFQIWRIRYWIRLHSQLYALFGDATRVFRERIGVAKTMAEKHAQFEQFAKDHPDTAYVYTNDLRIKALLSPAYRLEAVNLNELRTKEGWRITQENFRSIKQQFSAAGVPLILVYIPTKEIVYIDLLRQKGEVIPPQFANYDRAEHDLQRTFFAFCGSEGIYCHSVLPELVDALADGKKVYGETMDGHPLALGYRVIAESIWKYLLTTTLKK